MAGNFNDGSLAVAFNPTVTAQIQDRTLQRTFRDVLFPNLLFRMEAERELWAIHLGNNQTFTRVGEMETVERPVAPGQDPIPGGYPVEQWEATAQQWTNSIDTSMPTSYLTIASQYLRNIHQLGLNSGKSLNRIVRNKLYNAYVAGNTVVDVAASSSATTLHVANLNGFTFNLQNGRQQPVSASNPVNISIPAIAYTGQVTAFTPDVTGDLVHGGTLTITPAIGANVAARSAILTTKRSQLVYSGGGFSVDDVDTTDHFAVRDIRTAVAQLRFNNIPPHEDGLFHWHLGPGSEMQVFEDNEFQRVNQSLPDYVHYRRFALAVFGAGVFFRNNEVPSPTTCSTNVVKANTHGFELFNGAGTEIARPICTGAGVIEEKYIDESKYISDAGIMGRIGEFAVTNGGVQVITEGIRLVLRSPMDRLQQVTSAAWSFSGDWPIPTDELANSADTGIIGATYKRAVVVVHAA